MRHRGKTSYVLHPRQRLLGLEQLEVRQMLAGDLAAGTTAAEIASSQWFGSVAASNQPSHASSPSITASDISNAPVDIAASNASGQIDWIVQFRANAINGVRNAAGAADLLPQGGSQFQVIEGLGAVGELLARSYGITTEQAAAALRADKAISWFEADSLTQVNASAPSDPLYSLQWALNNTGQDGGAPGDDIDAAQAWKITTGSKNVVVAEIDSGVDYTDPDLAANIWTNPHAGQDGFSGDVHGYNFVSNTGDPIDDDGHGTFVAGEIGAVGNNGLGVTGVDWNVTIMPLKFLDASGDGYTSDAIRAINYAVMERTEFGVNVRVINASWTSGLNDPGLNAAIAAAGDAGILFVAAAGNSASNNDLTPVYPANTGLPNVISVAASDANNQIAIFSDYGANTVNLAAPGVDIYSTLPGGKYGYLSGTSMAAPEVAGVAALAWAADPNVTVAQVREAILQGVTQVPSLASKVSSGGVLNAFRTLKLLSALAETPPQTPISSLTPVPTSSTVSSPEPTPSPAATPAPTPSVPSAAPTQGMNPATAAVISIGATVTGDLASASQIDYFKVQLIAGQKYTFQTVLASLYDSVLTLLATNAESVIAQNDDMAPGNRASSITWQATATGSYFLAVGSFPGTPLGTFELSTSEQAIPISKPAPNTSVAPSPTPAGPILAPISGQAMAAGASLTLALAGSSPSGGRLSYSASSANHNAVSAVVYGDQLTLRAAAGFSGSVQIAVTVSDGVATGLQSFSVSVSNSVPSSGQTGNVAIPSVALTRTAGTVAVTDPFGGTTSSQAKTFWGPSLNALDALYGALGR